MRLFCKHKKVQMKKRKAEMEAMKWKENTSLQP
jgi:hypothetical protein